MLNKEYIAGLFDGDGWISIRPQSNKRYLSSITLQVGIVNTHPLINKFAKKFGGKVYITPAITNHKKIYRWILTKKKDINNFLVYIFSSLIIRKEAAKTMIKFVNLKTVSGKRRNNYLIIRALKYINKIRKLNGNVKRKDVSLYYGDKK